MSESAQHKPVQPLLLVIELSQPRKLLFSQQSSLFGKDSPPVKLAPQIHRREKVLHLSPNSFEQLCRGELASSNRRGWYFELLDQICPRTTIWERPFRLRSP